MPRKKEKDQSKLYAYPVRTRVTESVYLRLNAFVGNGDCHSIGEVARRVLSKEKILYVLKDGSMDSIMEELVTIRKELNAIGTNINQITRHFHSSVSADQKLFHALKIGEQYNLIDSNVKMLQEKISTLSKQWLQK